MSRAMIGGRTVVPRSQDRPPYWRYNPAERQLYMSAFHISAATVGDYVGELNRKKPDYLVGYASAHFFLARFIEEAGLQVHQPRAVLTSSEKLLGDMRGTISKVYGCEVFDGYSGVEACCLISECENHRLHVSPDVGFVEILDEDGRPVADGKDGEIVATGFLNHDQPLVRYRTGDVARWSTTPCDCGRAMPVVEEIVGRIEDTVIGPDGRETVRFHGLTLGIPEIRECQVVQEELDHIRVRVASDRPLANSEIATIKNRVTGRLGDVRVDVEPVEHIERSSRGKFKAVVSKVART
jgi:phenylacetate-CoA ligase